MTHVSDFFSVTCQHLIAESSRAINTLTPPCGWMRTGLKNKPYINLITIKLNFIHFNTTQKDITVTLKEYINTYKKSHTLPAPSC